MSVTEAGYKVSLTEGREVMVLDLKDGDFGVEYLSSEGKVLRFSLSPEAADATAQIILQIQRDRTSRQEKECIDEL